MADDKHVNVRVDFRAGGNMPQVVEGLRRKTDEVVKNLKKVQLPNAPKVLAQAKPFSTGPVPEAPATNAKLAKLMARQQTPEMTRGEAAGAGPPPKRPEIDLSKPRAARLAEQLKFEAANAAWVARLQEKNNRRVEAENLVKSAPSPALASMLARSMATAPALNPLSARALAGAGSYKQQPTSGGIPFGPPRPTVQQDATARGYGGLAERTAKMAGQRLDIGGRASVLGTPEYNRFLREKIALQKESATQTQKEQRAEDLMRYGRLGVALRTTASGMATLATASTIAGASLTGVVAVTAHNTPAWRTFSDSIGLVTTELGIAFTPVLAEAAYALQGMQQWIRAIDPALLSGIARWVAYGAAIAGVGAIVFRVGSLVKGGAALLGLVGGAGAGAAGAGAAAGGIGLGGMAGIGLGGAAAGIGVASLGPSAAGAAAAGPAAGAAGAAAGVGIKAAIMGGLALMGPVGWTIAGFGALMAGGALIDSMTKKPKLDSAEAQRMLAVSTGFQSQQIGVEDLHGSIQQQVVRDNMQQLQFDQQMRALEALTQQMARLGVSAHQLTQLANGV